MPALTEGHKHRLGRLAQSEEFMEAMEALADEICLEQVRGIKPPMALDEYGARVASGAVLQKLLDKMRELAVYTLA